MGRAPLSRRLFAAIELEEPARHEVASLQKRLAAQVSGPDAMLRWSRLDQMHLTLVFIGPVDPQRAATIVAAGEPPIAVAPFGLSLAGIGVFPPRGAPRVLWLGVEEGAESVIRLQHIVAGRLAAAGVELEARPFHPHVTLARWQESRGAEGRRVRGADAGRSAIRTMVDAVTLFESRPGPGGSIYTPIARTPLEAGHYR
jgi:2'-5' RNA ligase